jgi:hypothetical protein
MSGIHSILNAAKDIDRKERNNGIKSRLNGSLEFNSDRNIMYPIGDYSEFRKANSITNEELKEAKQLKRIGLRNSNSYQYSALDPYETINDYGNTYKNTVHNQLESSGYKGKGGKKRKQSRRKSRKSRKSKKSRRKH